MPQFKAAVSVAALIAAAALSCGAAQSQTYGQPYAAQYQAEEQAPDAQMDPRLQRQIVSYATRETPGTLIVDTSNTYLYLVLGNGQAMRYGIGVGREGFTWAGVQPIAKKAEWPDWYPPAEMIARQPYLPRMTRGAPAIRSARARSISAPANTAFTAPTIRPPSARPCRAAASA